MRDEDAREFEIVTSRHGPLLENLTHALGMRDAPTGRFRTALRWALGHNPTSAGTLARLPLARTAEEFAGTLFENDVTPLVNNIIAVDRHNSLRRFIVATLPKRRDVTGVVPLPGWDARYDFEQATAAELTVEVDPPSHFAVTANNDTLGAEAPFPIHTFAANSARADRVVELVGEGDAFTAADFEAMQADLKDLRAAALVPEFLPFIEDTGDPKLDVVHRELADWDYRAEASSPAAAVHYTFLDRMWHCRFLVRSLGKDFAVQPAAAPSLNRVEPRYYPAPIWDQDLLAESIQEVYRGVYDDLVRELGAPEQWRYGAIHQVHFWHTLRKRPPWEDMQVGPVPFGGSGTTLAMAMHMGRGPGKESGDDRVPQRVFHGPAFRLVVDLANPDHCRFVIASGNSGRPRSRHATDHFETWLKSEHYTVTLLRDELTVEETWRIA